MIMVNSTQIPDYPLDERRVVTSPVALKALAHPVRSVILDLLLERAATVTELASAIGRPKSTIAHHVAVLVDAGLLKVVRTRQVRAIEERTYGRTARLFAVGELQPDDIDPVPWAHPLRAAMHESEAAYRADTMWANTRHSRISRAQAREFWAELEALMVRFAELPREGESVFGFAVALYPTDYPVLPPAADPDDITPAGGARP
jgi:DNA-binding transcriptional ArsR family regulator